MLGFLFGKKHKFKLKEKMLVELEIEYPEGLRSYFSEVLETAPHRAHFTTPKEGNRFIRLNLDDKVKCIALIDKLIFEVNIKVKTLLDREFEAVISRRINDFETILAKFKKPEEFKMNIEVPLDFRAISTSHLQRAMTKTITNDYVDVVTNLPVPEGTDLKLIFRVPDSPPVETEAVSEKSEPLEEDSKKSKTRFTFSEKVKETDTIEQVTSFIVYYMRRTKRREGLEDNKEPLPPPRKEGK